MYGAIIGDICGSVYEWHPTKSTECLLFTPDVFFTDDTVLTVAVAHALMDTYGRNEDDPFIKYEAVSTMLYHYYCLYPGRGYGGRFDKWATSGHRKPYHSYGNGSAMRASAAGWMYDSIEDTLQAAVYSAAPTHDHPDGISGAQVVAGAIYLARTGHSKDAILNFAKTMDYQKLDEPIAETRKYYEFDVTCEGAIPSAIRAFYESTDFENAIRLAISLGGDADTQAAITGSIAEAYYGGVPDWMKEKVLALLDEPIKTQLDRFDKYYRK